MSLKDTCDRLETALDALALLVLLRASEQDPFSQFVAVSWCKESLRTLVELGELQLEQVWTEEMGEPLYEQMRRDGERFVALKERVRE